VRSYPSTGDEVNSWYLKADRNVFYILLLHRVIQRYALWGVVTYFTIGSTHPLTDQSDGSYDGPMRWRRWRTKKKKWNPGGGGEWSKIVFLRLLSVYIINILNQPYSHSGLWVFLVFLSLLSVFLLDHYVFFPVPLRWGAKLLPKMNSLTMCLYPRHDSHGGFLLKMKINFYYGGVFIYWSVLNW